MLPIAAITFSRTMAKGRRRKRTPSPTPSPSIRERPARRSSRPYTPRAARSTGPRNVFSCHGSLRCDTFTEENSYVALAAHTMDLGSTWQIQAPPGPRIIDNKLALELGMGGYEDIFVSGIGADSVQLSLKHSQ